MEMILESLLLVVILSLDAFVASFAYGSDGIQIPFRSVAIINIIGSGLLAVSLYIGSAIRPWLPGEAAKLICFGILFLLGIVKLFEGSIKAYIRKRKDLHKQVTFSALHLKFILHVYADPEKADQDSSRTLTSGEAASLGMALSLDGLAVGFGAALSHIEPLLAVGFSLLLGTTAVLLGGLLGERLSKRISLDLSWLGGVLLLLLAFFKL